MATNCKNEAREALDNLSEAGAKATLGVNQVGPSPATADALQEATRRIVEAFDPECVILFGSYACSTPTPDSDIDLLIVMASDERPTKRSTRVARVLLDIPFPMDILVRTPDELRYRLQIGDRFIREILERGVVLYERGGPIILERVGSQG